MEKSDNCSRSSFRALEMQELDRKRISMDIHDTTVQNLTTLVHKTEYVSKLMDLDIVGAKLELNTMTDILRQSIDELREIIYDLRPMCIDDLGLVIAIDRYITQIKLEDERLKYKFSVNNKENKKVLSIINLTIFRVLQEALSNVRKHSNANNVSINLTYNANSIEILIKDDGIGFDMSNKKCKNFGLSIMYERVKMLSGKIDIDSKIGKGTMIKVCVPIVEEEEYDTN